MAKSKIVAANGKIAEKVVGAYEKVENAVVDRYLAKDGETVQEAKERLRNHP